MKNMTKGIDYNENEDLPCPYDAPVDVMREGFESLYTGAIIDIFQEMDIHHKWLGPEIKCRTNNLKKESVAGFAFTVQWITDPRPDERDKPASKMVDSYPEGSMIVVDTGSDNTSGFWGELATTVCIENGVRGAVINGGAKDTGFVKDMDFPIFSEFTSPVDGFYRSRLRGWQIPIWINDIRIEPWDFIVGDSDGVLVIHQDIAETVLDKALERADQEDDVREMLKQGVSSKQASEETGRKDL